MEKRILISMVDYVLEKDKTFNFNQSDLFDYEKIINYAKFISMPLTLGMFVPMDEDGNIFKRTPEDFETYLRDSRDGGWWQEFYEYRDKYQKALNNVIFEGVSIVDLDNLKNHYRIFINDLCVWTTVGSINQKVEDLINFGLTIAQSSITKYKI